MILTLLYLIKSGDSCGKVLPAMARTFFATTAKGMESLLAQELRDLGAEKVEETRAGVKFQGEIQTAYKACMHSRIANRILLPLERFHAPDPEKLYGKVKSIRWDLHMGTHQTLAVDFTSTRSGITHTHYGALKVKDAIVDQFRSKTGERPSIQIHRPDIRINVYVHEDEATVSLDLSGESLHRRGYREDGGESAHAAHLKENLAAAILLTAKWPEVAAQGGAFLDPMCGSGTLPIEAAHIAMKRAPGLGRNHYGFLGWKQHDRAAWRRIVGEAERAVIQDRKLLPTIVGFDRDSRAIRIANENIEKAGVRGWVHVERGDFETAAPPSGCEKGIIVINPPYGERLGEVEELKPLYKQMGDSFKQKFKGWSGFIFTGSPELAKVIGLKAQRRHILYNGPIECRLLEYQLY